MNSTALAIVLLAEVLPLSFVVWLAINMGPKMDEDGDLDYVEKRLASMPFLIVRWVVVAFICINLIAGVTGLLGGRHG